MRLASIARCSCLALLLSLPAVGRAHSEPAPGDPDGSDAAVQRARLEFFETRIRPLLAERCFKCHGPDKQRAELRLDSRDGQLRGGESGPAVVPGQPDESLIIEAIGYESFEMPPDGQLAAEQIADVRRWVEMGAPWPADKATRPTASTAETPRITDQDRDYWAFQPMQRAALPNIQNTAWPLNEIDHFIVQGLESAGLEPAARADRRTLIRRLYFDVIGLPPTPEEVEQFVNDPSEQAYERIVDQLLESPHYGERWGRHWLDLVRYAESDGFKQDAFREQAWRYRDYVIQSFNNDKPYNQFVLENLAGDEQDPDDLDAQVATGFLRHTIYEYNQRDVRTQWDNMLNELTDVTADVFLGLGIGCARCHDHKFDPILQEDYFRLRAFFEPLLPRDRPLGTGEQLAEYQRQLAEWEAATADIRRQIDELEAPLRQRVADAAIDKFPPDVRPLLRRAPEQRDPQEHQLAELAFRQVQVEWDNLDFAAKLKGEDKERWQQLQEKLAEHDALKPKPLPLAMLVQDVGPTAPATTVPGRSQRTVEPGFLTLMDPDPAAIPEPSMATTTGRRTALARWLTRPDHPLTARVMVNRIWQFHFGRGLVETTSDFGHLGQPPSHPELLDWLALRFVDGGWRMKPIHRLILTSATYQQSALGRGSARALQIDPQNRLLWRMETRRLNAERIRDTILAVSGELDLSLGGPSVDDAVPRRTIYTKYFRNRQDPLLDVFDRPDGISSTAGRNVTTTPLQALTMINGLWTLQRAEVLANDVVAQTAQGPWPDRVQTLYLRLYGRPPMQSELALAESFLSDDSAESWLDYCHVLLNSNELIYVD